MTTGATSFGLGTRDMVLTRREIDVVVTGGAGRLAGKLLPVLAFGSAMTGFTVSQILGQPVAHYDLGVAQVRIVGHFLTVAHHEIGLAAFNARQQFAAVDFVNEDFKFEILTALGVSELGGVTESAVIYGPPRATVIFERVVAVVAGGGFDDGSMDLDLTP